MLTELSEAVCVGSAWMRPAPSPHISSSSPTPTPGLSTGRMPRLLGEVARRREPPDLDQAATHYRQALTLAEAVGMRPHGALPSGPRGTV